MTLRPKFPKWKITIPRPNLKHIHIPDLPIRPKITLRPAHRLPHEQIDTPPPRLSGEQKQQLGD